MATKQTNSSIINYSRNNDFSNQMQPIAIKNHYVNVWPGVKIFEIDIDTKSELSKMIDVGGADKMLRFGNRNVAFLAQRFRKSEYIKYDEFTMRNTEFNKAMIAIDEDRFVASYYSYGYANQEKTDFIKICILKYRDLLLHIRNLPTLPWRSNQDGTRFYYIKFSTIPNDIFIYQWEIQGRLF